MAETTIEWTEHTWNPIRGCTRVSPGCGGPGPHGGCYAERVAARFSGPGMPYEGIAEMRGLPLLCLGTASDGHPLHPLIPSYDRPILPWSPLGRPTAPPHPKEP